MALGVFQTGWMRLLSLILQGCCVGVLCSDWAVRVPSTPLCAVAGSSVVLPCFYDYPQPYRVLFEMWCRDQSRCITPRYVYHSQGIFPEPASQGRKPLVFCIEVLQFDVMWLLKTTSVMLVITLTLPGVCESNWKVTLSNLQLCALNGSSVVFGCTYDYPSDQTITNTFWYFWSQGKNNDLLMSKEYTERSIYLGNKEHNCTLRINNLVSSDATKYCFRFETINTNKKPNAWSSKTSVTLTLTAKNTVLMPVYIGSVAAVFMVIIPLWMCKSQFKLCQKTAVDRKDDQNPVLSSRRTRNDPATQETRTEEQENALYANVQLPPSHTHHQDSSLYSVVQPPPPLNPPDLHYASFDFQQSHNSIDGVQLSGPHGRDDVVYSTVKSRQANVTDNLQPEESLEVDHSVIYSTVAKPEA
ncbi:unnamed protein product [Coregonus sp. 'balchen']|nr:unnamed protein product [Coregonus sp. 'balchen']